MAYTDLVDDEIVVQTDYSEANLIKLVPGFRWDPAHKVWHAPVSWAACQALRGVFGERLQLGPALIAWARHEIDTRIDPCLALRELTDLPGDGPGFDRLRPYQKPGASFLAYARRCVLGDDMGTGKTVQAIVALNILEQAGETVYPALVIAPNSVKGSWRNHFADWADNVTTFVVQSGKNKQKLFNDAQLAIAAGERVVIIINWEAVRLHSRLAPYGTIKLKRCTQHGGDETKLSACEVHDKELNAIPFRTVIADEAHKQKDPKSKQTRAAWAVQHQAAIRWSMTGTMIANHPGDAWGILHGVRPDDFPTKTKYNDRYCLLSWNAFGGLDIIGINPQTRDEFFRIFDPIFRRMPKSLVLTDLPPKQRIKRYAEMSAKQKKAYQQIEDGMVTRLDDGRLVVTTNNLTKNLRLIQFSSSYAEVNDQGEVRLSDPSNKLDELMNLLDGELAGKQVVVAAESRQLIELAQKRLTEATPPISWAAVTGGQTTDQRDVGIASFMAGETRVMLFTIKAGGTGITLTAADTIVFLQRSWSMLENKQAEDRIHRIGAEHHESISVIDIVAPGTVEEDQILRLYEKAERLEEINRDKETLRKAGDLAALAALEAEEANIMASDLTGVEELGGLELPPPVLC